MYSQILPVSSSIRLIHPGGRGLLLSTAGWSPKNEKQKHEIMAVLLKRES